MLLLKGSFQDSVSLMLISRKLSESPKVEEISVMMGTPANKSLLEVTGFWHPQFSEATPNDICVAIKAESADETIAEEIGAALETALKAIAQGSQGGKTAAGAQLAHRQAEAARRQSGADLDRRRIRGGAGG